MKVRAFLFVAMLFVLPHGLPAQSYYPAGLGSTSLTLWLTASDATTVLNSSGNQAANGDLIKTWKDKSPIGANATQSTSASRPAFATNQLNGFGAVQFQNTSQYLSGASGAYQTIIAVRSMPGTGHYQELFTSPANQDFSIRGGGASTTYTDGPNSNDWVTGTGSTPTQWINGVQSLAGSSTNHILVAAAASPTNATYSISNVNASAAWSGRGMNGNDPVYELLNYKTTLTTTQRILLENYEGAEWGLISLLPTSGYTTFTPPTISTFNRNLVGIGYTSATDNFLADVAGSTDGLGFSSGSGTTDFLNTAGFVMAAHNGQANTTLTNATIPGVTSVFPLSEWNRSWYVQTNNGNTAGQLTLNFNFSDYSGTTPNGFYTYYLLYNATSGTFSSGTNHLITTVSSTTSGNIVSFKVNAANLPNGYYTIIYSLGPIALPVTVTGLHAAREEGGNLLTWSVSGGEAVDHFDIQRSTDGDHFSTIGTVSALGAGSLVDDYRYLDIQPANGTNYYRLDMKGGDGQGLYSVVVPVQSDAIAGVNPHIWPNPVTQVMHIHMDQASQTETEVRIFNLAGMLVGAVTGASNTMGLNIPVNQLRTGIYMVEIHTGNRTYISKMMKE